MSPARRQVASGATKKASAAKRSGRTAHRSSRAAIQYQRQGRYLDDRPLGRRVSTGGGGSNRSHRQLPLRCASPTHCTPSAVPVDPELKMASNHCSRRSQPLQNHTVREESEGLPVCSGDVRPVCTPTSRAHSPQDAEDHRCWNQQQLLARAHDATAVRTAPLPISLPPPKPHHAAAPPPHQGDPAPTIPTGRASCFPLLLRSYLSPSSASSSPEAPTGNGSYKLVVPQVRNAETGRIPTSHRTRVPTGKPPGIALKITRFGDVGSLRPGWPSEQPDRAAGVLDLVSPCSTRLVRVFSLSRAVRRRP